MVFGGEAFGRGLGLEEVLRLGLSYGISALLEETPKSSLFLTAYEHIVKNKTTTIKKPSCLQARKRTLTRNPTLLDLGLGLFSLQNC
jgi:hypothetical protein